MGSALFEILASLWVPAAALCGLPAALALAKKRLDLEAPEALALASALSLAWCMAGGMLLAGTGGLNSWAVWLWLAGGTCASLLFAWRAEISLADWRPKVSNWGSLVLLAPPALMMLAFATVPPWYRDSLVYHLALPREFAREGAAFWPDDNIFAAFPIAWELALSFLYTLGAEPNFDPVFNPRLAGAWVMLAAALAAVSLARAAGATRNLAAASGALFLLLPTVVEYGPSAYVEGPLLLFVTLALWSTLRSVDLTSGISLWWLSAGLAGVACWIKYPGLAIVAFLAGATSFIECLSARERTLLAWGKYASRWSALAALIGCPFLLRNAVVRGNPVFPTAYGIFGGEGWDTWRAWAYGVTLQNYGYGRGWWDYLQLPWRLFTEHDLTGGFEGSLGPIVALGGVAGIWLCRRPEDRSKSGTLLGWVLFGSLFWALTVQQTRFYLFVTPALLSLLAVAGTRILSAQVRPRVAWIAICAVLSLQLAWSAAPVASLWNRQATTQWLSGALDEETFLAGMMPESYPPMRALDDHVPADGRVWLVWMRGYTYYLDRPYRMDCVFEAWRLEALLEEVEEPGELAAKLHRDGITHLLINHRFFLQNGNADLRPGRTELLRERFAQALERSAVRRVESWGPVTLYAVADKPLSRGGAEALHARTMPRH